MKNLHVPIYIFLTLVFILIKNFYLHSKTLINFNFLRQSIEDFLLIIIIIITFLLHYLSRLSFQPEYLKE